jgi:hemolysin activation/secretion protein
VGVLSLSVCQGVDVVTPSRWKPALYGRILPVAFLLAVCVGVSPAAAPPPAASNQSSAQNYFDVLEFRVLGNTTLSDREIETTLYPLLGEHKTLADLEVARAALEKTYHDRGFSTVFVDIPEQEISEKIVRLKVTEGRLNSVHIAGARYFSERRILAAVPEAAPGIVPNVARLQEQLSAVNVTSADRAVVPVLKAGPVPGTVDLALNVNDHFPVHGSIDLDNQNTPGTETLRATVALNYSNLFSEFDNAAVQYQSSPQNFSQVRVFAVNYAWGSVPYGIHPSVYFIDSDSNVPAVSTLGVVGKGQIYGARLSMPLTDAPGMPQSFTVGADYKHFRESIALQSQSSETRSSVNTPISYTNLSVAYGGYWHSGRLQGSLSSSANFGARGAPNSPSAFADKRFKGEPNYFYIKIDSTLNIALPVGFQLNLRTDGQFAVEPLITNEQFSITGASGVRGYLEAEVLSDNGVLGGVQLQSPSWTIKTFPLGNVFAFYDAGHSHVIDGLEGEQVAYNLRSVGAGLNLLPGKLFTGSVTWAYPLSDGPNTHRGDSRILFIARGSF